MKILALLMPLIAAIGALDTGSAEKPAETIRFNADEARRGVAADRRHVYVIANSSIGKYDKRSGKKLASWSGGSWGADGLLYITGHDRRELYALQLPQAGSTLQHVATLPLASPGQAIDWDPYQHRILWSVDRAAGQVVAAKMPLAPQDVSE